MTMKLKINNTKLRKAISVLLTIAVCAGLMPFASAVEDKWKFMTLESPGQTMLSQSNYAERSAQVHFPFQPVMEGEEDEAAYISALLSFSIQANQPMRLEVYKIPPQYMLNASQGVSNVSLASGGAANLTQYDPRREENFIGYLS